MQHRRQGTPLSLIVNLDVADEVILSRISDRWVHLPSGRVYNLSYNPPKVPGLDDVTGEPLTKRPDNNPVRIFSLSILSCARLTPHIGGVCSSTGEILRINLTPPRVLPLSTTPLPGENGDPVRLNIGRDLAPA